MTVDIEPSSVSHYSACLLAFYFRPHGACVKNGNGTIEFELDRLTYSNEIHVT